MASASLGSPALLPPQPAYAPSAPQPPLMPQAVQTPPKPDARRGFKIWLIGAIVIAVVGAAASVGLYIAFHLEGWTSSGVASSAHFTRCAVGTGYDPDTGTIRGESTSFSESDPNLQIGGNGTITLVCFVASNANINDVTDQLMTPNPTFDGSENPLNTNSDTVHGVYYDYGVSGGDLAAIPRNWIGSYTWEVFYAGVQEISLHFQVTS